MAPTVKDGKRKATTSKAEKKESPKESPKKMEEVEFEGIEDSEGEGEEESSHESESQSDSESESSNEDKQATEPEPAPAPASAKKQKKNQEKSEKPSDDKPGVVYIGRIPHGFYEHEMRAYFSQFGTISRLRLARNRTTARPKHYAFIEFASSAVARVVADTMNNYLMYGHILKCRLLSEDQIHPDLWKGANRRFKQVPWNDIEKRRLNAGKTRDAWKKKIDKETRRRSRRADKLKQLDYQFEMPVLKSADEVSAQK